MKTKFILFSLLFFFPLFSKSQVYSNGDLSLSFSQAPNHDSFMCQSTCVFTANITKTNSFIGDEVIIKNLNNSIILTSIINSSGQNPWIINYNFQMDSINDRYINAGNAIFDMPLIKVNSGIDSVFSLQQTFHYTVPDPCEFDYVNGNLYLDENNDCILNNIDSALINIPIKVYANFSNQPVIEYSSVSGLWGYYYFQIQKSWLTDFTVNINPTFQFAFPSIACNSILRKLSFTSLPQSNANFALQKEHNVDVETDILTVPNIIPNKPFYLSTVAKNKGFHHTNINLTLVKDTKTTYVDSLSYYPATSINGDTISWNFGSSVNIQSSQFEHWNRIAGAFLIPNANAVVGDTLCFLAYTNIPGNDADTTNNSYKIFVPVVNNYNETQKTVTPKGDGVDGLIPINTEWLTYTIHYKIIADTDQVYFKILDTIDANLDPNTIELIGSSIRLTAEWVEPNVIQFLTFQGHGIVSSMNDLIDSAGAEKQIKYRIKLKPNLPQGTQIKNTAQIYKYKNANVEVTNTNTCINTLAYPNQLISKNITNNIEVFPNPAKDNISIKFFNDNTIKNRHIKIMNLNGQLVKEIHSNAFSTLTIDIKEFNIGIYFIKIQEKDKVLVSKFVVEK